jgi:two-component system, NtrC family, response regulator HydG
MKTKQSKNIYIIDNEQIVIKTLQGFLIDLGHKVVTFNSPLHLINTKEKNSNPVDLILIGLNLPNDEGVILIQAIRKMYPDTAIVIMTGYGPVLPHEDALAYGILSYLTKPVRLGELELLLERLSSNQSEITAFNKIYKKRINGTDI